MTDTFKSHGTLEVDGKSYRIARLKALADKGYDLDRLPYALKILLENLLRREDGKSVPAADVEALAGWKPNSGKAEEIAFMPGRVLLQDFTGVPAVVDLAAMRDAMAKLGGDPTRINPLQPVELVIDHSVQVDSYGSADSEAINAKREYERNNERYRFLRWGQTAFDNFRAVPPDVGIVHQVNLEYLARCVMAGEHDGETWAYPDTVVGTDSHTTMINGLGVLGWGVGGIEAEAAMLGQPVSMLIPEVVGFRLLGKLAEGTTATDLVLRVVEMLRELGVVGKFVEFFGAGLVNLTLADRATIANMAPEYGATCGIFPTDAETIDFMRFSGRDEHGIKLTEAYMKEQGLFHTAGQPEADYSDVLELDMGSVVPSLAGPKRPQDRLSLGEVKPSFASTLAEMVPGGGKPELPIDLNGKSDTLTHGSVVIAAITSCTNTSNPGVMLAAGLVAKKANALGIKSRSYVKTSLAPGSLVVTDYLKRSGLLGELEQQGFYVVGYGCTTCIGNSGPLADPVTAGILENDLLVSSVLSGNRNFEGRVHAHVKANYLASPPLVVAYALAGRVDFDPKTEPLGQGSDGKDVFLKDVWPTQAEVQEAMRAGVTSEQYKSRYANVYEGSEAWRALEIPSGSTYAWEPDSTYVKSPPFFDGMSKDISPVSDIKDARCLVLLGDSITTDHISPAGAIKPDSPAGAYLQEKGVAPSDFNSYGSRRGNHEIMMRGTFANVRLRNKLTPGIEGSSTLHLPAGDQMSIFDAAMKYVDAGVPSIILCGKEYGTGSSRDWAAKGPSLLGVRGVIAQSYERIHRSNLVGMGVLPMEFLAGESAESLGLDGHESFSFSGLEDMYAAGFKPGGQLSVTAAAADGKATSFQVNLRIDTPEESLYYQNGGILHYVLRKLLTS